MCGIVGIRSFDGRDDASLRRDAEAMAEKLRHRGPDDDGVFAQHGVAFGFRRLSILELTPAGAQPMHSAGGRYTLVSNGESTTASGCAASCRRGCGAGTPTLK